MVATLMRLVVLIALVTLPACAAPSSGGILSVSIDGGDQTIAVGRTLTLDATVAATGGASDAVAWSSSSTSVASIDAAGQVTAHSTGATIITATSIADPSKSDAIVLTVTPPAAVAWARQFGTDAADRAYGVAIDAAGNVYVAGSTDGALEGNNLGDADAFISAYDRDGNHRWTRQFGTSGQDRAFGIAVDTSGNVYASGYTGGALEGPVAGVFDAFVRSYDRDGALRWTRQFGSGDQDQAIGIVVDASDHVYVTGYTAGALEGANAGGADAFVRSYDRDGALRWTRQFGTSAGDIARDVASDADGNVYVVGSTAGGLVGGNLGSNDAFVRSYDRDGALRWTRQFGTSAGDYGSCIATDASGNAYAVGTTLGSLAGGNLGSNDVFVRSYDRDGALRWTRQFGSDGDDDGSGVAADASGNVLAVGSTVGALAGGNAGGYDAFVRSFDAGGTLRWTRQFGTSSGDSASDVAVDAHGNAHVTGATNGALVGVSNGGTDAFLQKFGP